MLTPLDIQKKEFKRSVRGYNVEMVDQFLDQLLGDYESVFLENQLLKEKLEASDEVKNRYQEMEKTIKDAVIMAQKNADELQRNALREADVLLEEARLRAEKIIGEASEKASRTLREARDQARFRTEEAEERVRAVLAEYRYLERQVQIFRVKFRSFLEAQLELLGKQDEEAREMALSIGSGLDGAAAGQEESDGPVETQRAESLAGASESEEGEAAGQTDR
ncbi:MAG: DivIVA domain-containing protein [Firmicutes bacterium]|nr:DivIVA domain-containing protein [Bacillota bacterium]